MWRQQQQNRKKPNSAISNQIYKIKSHSELLFSCFCNEHTVSDLTPNSKTVRQAVPTICHNSHSCSYTIFLACAAGCSGASRLFTSANRRIKPGSTADTRTRRKCIRAAASAGGPSCCFTGRMEDILEVRRENGSVNHQTPWGLARRNLRAPTRGNTQGLTVVGCFQSCSSCMREHFIIKPLQNSTKSPQHVFNFGHEMIIIELRRQKMRSCFYPVLSEVTDQ